MASATKKETKKVKRSKSISLYPLSLEEALKIALTTSLPEKAHRDKKIGRRKKKEK